MFSSPTAARRGSRRQSNPLVFRELQYEEFLREKELEEQLSSSPTQPGRFTSSTLQQPTPVTPYAPSRLPTFQESNVRTDVVAVAPRRPSDFRAEMVGPRLTVSVTPNDWGRTTGAHTCSYCHQEAPPPPSSYCYHNNVR